MELTVRPNTRIFRPPSSSREAFTRTQAPLERDPISPTVFQAIVNGVGGIEVVPELVAYLRSRGEEISDDRLKAIESAILQKNFIHRNTFKENAHTLLSRTLTEEISRLEPKKPYLYVGTLQTPSKPLWQIILPPEAAKWFENPDSFFTLIKKEFLKECGEKDLLQGSTDLKSIVSEGFLQIQKKMESLLPPSWYQAIARSLKQDYNELISEKMEGTVWERMLQGNIEENLKTCFHDVFVSVQANLTGKLNDLIKESSSWVPGPLRPILSSVGIKMPENTEFWLEITKDETGLFTVNLYGDDQTGTLKFPITFSHVREDQLKEEFWEAVLMYTLWSQNPEKQISAHITHVYKTLSDLLGSEGELSATSINGSSSWEMCRAYFGNIDDSFVEEIKKTSPPPTPPQQVSRPHKDLLPPFLLDLISQMGPKASDITTLKEVVSAILGEEITPALDTLLKQLPEQTSIKSVPKTLPKSWSQILGFDFVSDVKKMRLSLLHAVRALSNISLFITSFMSWVFTIHLLTALLTIFFPGIGLLISVPIEYLAALLLMYGTKVLKEIVPEKYVKQISYFFEFYSTFKAHLQYQIQLLLLKFASTYIINPGLINNAKKQIKIWQTELTRTGELDYLVTKKQKPTSPKKQVQNRAPPQRPTVLALDSVHSPAICVITKENLSSYLSQWISEASSLSNPYQKLHFLNSRIRNLPIPGNIHGNLWEELENPNAILNLLRDLMCSFINYELSSRHEKIEVVTSLYAIYTMIDACSRHPKTTNRIPSTYLSNGHSFLLFLNTPGVRASRSRTRLQMKNIARFFGGDPNHVYTKKELEKLAPASMLFENYDAIKNGKIPKGDRAYLQTLIPEGGDQSFEQLIKLFAETPQLRPYYLLRSIHIIARKTLVKYYLPENYLAEVTFTAKKEAPMGRLRTLFHATTFQYFRTTELYPSAYITDSSYDTNMPYPDLYDCFVRENTSFTRMNFPFESKRTQSQIVSGNPILPEMHSLYKKEIFFLLEMLDQVKPDQIIRTMSLFLQNPALLKDRRLAHLFEIFLLQPVAIFEAFKERPDLLPEMGERFFLLIQKLRALNDEKRALFVAKIANDFLFLCEDFDPDIHLKTRSFKALVKEQFNSPLSKLVLCSMYLNTNPETASREDSAEVIEVIQNALAAFPTYFPAQHTLPYGLEDVVFKTKELLWTWGHHIPPQEERAPTPPPAPPAPPSPKIEWKVDLSVDEHNLYLLDWFQPLSEVEVFANGDHVTRLEFKKLQLEFEVIKENGFYRAYAKDPKLKKFFIAKKQKHSKFTPYGSYLLLQTKEGDRKIQLPVYSNTLLFGERFLYSFKELHSPFLEKLLGMMDPSDSVYTYNVSTDGSLDSNDPKAIAYLALFHIAKDDFASAKKYISKLERLGKRKPFCKESVAHIQSLFILLFLSKHETASSVFLKLIALNEENRLIQQVSPEPSTSLEEEKIALWLMVQSKYHAYLEEEKKGLSEIDELFILKYIVSNCPVPKALQKISSSLVNLSMMPSCSKRYAHLRKKYLEETTSWKTKAEELFLEMILGDTPGDGSASSEAPSSSSLPNRIQKFIELLEHPLFSSSNFSLAGKIDFQKTIPLDSPDLSICKLTPSNIHLFFYYYYTLLYEKTPGTWETLAQNLCRIHIKFTQPNERLLLYILQTIAKTPNAKAIFPNRAHIYDESATYLLIETCAKVNAEETFFSELKKRVTLKGAFSLAKTAATTAVTSSIGAALLPLQAAIFAGRGLIGCARILQRSDDLPKPNLQKVSLSLPIDEEVMEILSQRESEIDALLSLSGGEPLEEELEEPDFLSYDDITETSLLREFAKINKSIEEHFLRTKKSPIKHTFKGFRRKIERELAIEKEEIETALGLSFEEIEQKFLDDDEDIFPREILIKIYLYKVSKSRWNAFFKRGAVKRAYKFNEISERALRAFITFEEKGETLIWEKQYLPLIKLIESTHSRKVSQMIMGLGKTDTLMPIMGMLDANGEKLVINVRPAPIAPSAIEKSAERSHVLFSRLTSAIPLSRTGWTSERLEALYLKVLQIIQGKEEWDGIKEEFQSLELRCIEEALDLFGKFESSSKEEWHKRLRLFQKILSLLRTRGKAHIDEAHICFDRKTELCYPLGASYPLKEEHAEIMEEVLLAFLTTPELSRFMSAYREAPQKIHRSVYESEILPVLARKLANGDKSVRDYFLNRITTHEKYPRLDLIKGALNHLLPSILSELMHVSYAAPKESSKEFAIPSEGNENPQEQSTFKNHFSAWMKTALLLTHDRLNPSQLERFITLLQERARLELKGKPQTIEHLNQTITGRYFSEQCLGFNLFGFEEKDKPLIFEKLNRSDLVVLDYARLIIRKQIRYYEHSISSNSHNFASMFREFSSYTASLHNRGVFPKESAVLEDPGTIGETVCLLKERAPPCHVLDLSTPQDALHEILSKFFIPGPKFRAIIDRGAIFNGLSNEAVAREILAHISAHQRDLQGVVFYNHEKKLMILEKGNRSAIPFEETKIPPEKRITYFDQSHTYAADIIQGFEAKAIVTIGEDLITEDHAQAIWRMRGLKTKGQNVEFVMTQHTSKLISKELPTTTEDVIRFTIRNQAIMSEEDNYFSDLAALSNIVRRAVLDKALAAPSVEQMITIIRAFKELFLQNNSGDPSDFFGGMDLLVSPHEMFSSAKEKLMRLLSKTPLFTPDELEDIFDELSKIGDQYYPEKVHKREMISVHAKESVSVDEETHDEELEEQEVELTQAIAIQANSYPYPRFGHPHKSWDYAKDFSLLLAEADALPAFASSIWTLLRLFSMRQILTSHELGSLKAMAYFIDPRILATNNLFLDPTNAFDPFQIPPLEALVIEDEGNITKLILLSSQDAVEWRKKLESAKEKIALFDLNTKLVVKESRQGINKALLRNPSFHLMLLQIRFLRGDADYEPHETELLYPWLEKLPLQAIKDYFNEPHRKADYNASSLQYFVYSKENETGRPSIFLRA